MGSNEYIQFIGHEEIEAFDEVRTMCFFEKKEEENEFWDLVLSSGNCKGLHEMNFDHFETAYLVARSILRKRGQNIFKK